MQAAEQVQETVPAAVPEAAAAEPVSMSLEEAAKQVFGEAPTDGAAADAAAAGDAAPLEEEKPAEPAADPKQERVAARIAVAKRAELKAAQDRAELKSLRAEHDRREADLKEREARFRLLEEDPVKAFEVLKLEPRTFLEKLSGEYKPEAVTDRQVKALQAEIESLKQERAKEREASQRSAQRQASDAAWQQASADFVRFVEAGAERFPHLVAEYTEGEAVAAAERALLEHVAVDDDGRPITRAEAYRAEFGDYPDNDVIAEFLDAQAKQRAEARQNSAWRKQVPATHGSQPLSNGETNHKAPPVNKGSSPRTLTSRAASEKASPPKQWSQEAADEESIRILSRAFRS